jgi:predicted ATPase/class 3 adenylate cyclase
MSDDQAAMRNLPSGDVTFLFTDIEGSTRLLHELGAAAYAGELAQHRQVLRAAFSRYGGVEVDTQGDAFFVAFARVASAVEAAQAIKAGLAFGPIKVRMGLHTGTPLVTEEGYVGNDVHQAARIAAAGHGGQVVVSPMTAALVREEFSLAPLGTHRLKDFDEPVSLFQLGDEAFPPLKTIANTNLPTPVSSFLGREQELFKASQVIATTRLLTVTGPGGAGKTRFALELARRVREERFADYRDGVFFVPLAALRDPALVLDTVAQSIGAKVGLREEIADKQMLLLLDNFEQVMGAASELSGVLDVCSNLSILVTSREVLHIRGEVEYELPPLAEADGVLLFSERAQQRPDADIRELCRRLDGLPLAIELAAARARMLSPAELLARLSQRLDLLKGGRDADPRQQTLRAAIEWSHDLLTEQEQVLFRRLAVFAGTWTLEAAAAVVEAEIDTLQSLFDKSLLRRSENGRFFMLETIREYARERLEEAREVEDLERRHAEFLLAFTGKALENPERTEIARVLAPERENLRAAIDWALGAGEEETSLLLATAYGHLCAYHGPFGEGSLRLEAALKKGGTQTSTARAKALQAVSSLAVRQGEFERAQTAADEWLTLARSIGEAPDVAAALRALGMIACDLRDYEAAESLQREALAMFQRSGDDRQVRESFNMLAFVGLARRDYPQARLAIQEALTLSREAGDSRGILLGTGNLAHVALRQGETQEALDLLGEAIPLAHDQFNLEYLAELLNQIAVVALRWHHYERAAVLLGGSEALLEDAGGVREPVWHELHEETVSILQRELGDRLAASRQEGRAMNLEELVTYAVQFIGSMSV